MFTGIIEETGIVTRVIPGEKSRGLVIRGSRAVRGLRQGDSLAVNGCCLTVVSVRSLKRGRQVRFDLLKETWERTNFCELAPGGKVNLERPLKVNGRVHGHFVTGHVDGCGRVRRLERHGSDHLVDVEAPREVMRYMVPKGSVALDGISLTVAEVTSRRFRVWIIPHTWEVTALHERRVGDRVNLEADLLGKYAAKYAQRG